MPTENELRDVLLSLEQGAPTVQGVLETVNLHSAPLPSLGRHRQWLLAATASAAVLVSALATTMYYGTPGQGGTSRGSASGDSASPDVTPAWRFAVSPAADFVAVRDRIDRVGPVTWLQQSAAITATKSPASGRFTLQIDSPGGYQAQLAQQKIGGEGSTLSLNGRPAYFRSGSPLDQAVPTDVGTVDPDPWLAAAGNPDNQPSLIWQLPNGTWGMLMGTFGFEATNYTFNNAEARVEMLRIAHAVHYVAPQSVTMPFAFTKLPTGLVPESMRTFTQPEAACLGYGTGVAPSTTGTPSAGITVCRVATGSALDGPDTAQSPFDSMVGANSELASRTLSDGTTLLVLASPVRPLHVTQAQAEQLLQHADVRPTLDTPSTWITVK